MGSTHGAASGPQQVLSFLLQDEVFGMDIRCVREIIQHAAVTVVPHMPDCVRGVINLRGAVVPVIDLQRRFGRGSAVVGKRTCIVVFDASQDGERMELGLMVDAVTEVLTIAADQIEAAPPFGTTIRREFIQGLGKVPGGFITLLEPARALDVDDIAGVSVQAESA